MQRQLADQRAQHAQLVGHARQVREQVAHPQAALAALPERLQRLLIKLIVIACIAVALVLAWYGGAIAVHDYLGNEKDVRSLDMPRWMLIAFMPLSFGMMAIEFLRLLVRGESPYGAGLVHGGDVGG